MTKQEFTALLLEAAQTSQFAAFLRQAKADGLLTEFLPEIDCQDQYFHDIRFHPEGAVVDENGTVVRYGSVWDHTLTAIEDYAGKDLLVNLGLLFHDIGKPAAAIHNSSPIFHNFPGHENAGIPLMYRVGKRLGFSDTFKEQLVFIVSGHMLICRFPEMRKSKIIALITHPDWAVLREVSLHDDCSRKPAFDPKNWDIYDAIVNQIQAELNQPKPFQIDGEMAKAVTGLAEGPELGKIIRRATAIVREHPELEHSPQEAILQAMRNS